MRMFWNDARPKLEAQNSDMFYLFLFKMIDETNAITENQIIKKNLKKKKV